MKGENPHGGEIRLRLARIDQLFNSLDPSPFPGTKVAAVLTIAGALAVSWLLGVPYPVLAAQAAVLAAAGLFVLTRPSTPED